MVVMISAEDKELCRSFFRKLNKKRTYRQAFDHEIKGQSPTKKLKTNLIYALAKAITPVLQPPVYLQEKRVPIVKPLVFIGLEKYK